MVDSKSKAVKYLDASLTRRNLMKAGGVAAIGLIFSKPIIDTIRPKHVFAATYVAGCTPGFWKNHVDNNETGNVDWPGGILTTDLFITYFSIGSFTTWLGGTRNLLQVLEEGGGCEKALGRHAVAALLNATLLGGTTFGKSPTLVTSEVSAKLVEGNCSNILDYKDILDALNNAGCLDGAMIADDPV